MITIKTEIKGFPLYLATNSGNIISLQKRRPRILKPRTTRHGYLHVKIFADGSHKDVSVHRLVATSFIQNPENKPHVNHKNGIKTDNRVENLEWVTRSENERHAWSIGLRENTREAARRTGIKYAGENHGCSKLTDVQCQEIRTKYANGGISQRKIAEDYAICQSQVSLITSNKRRKA